MDLLSHFLTSLRIESTSISRWDLSEPWGVNVINFTPGFCLSVAKGSCWFQHSNSHAIELSEGDSVIALNGSNCAILSSPEVDPIDIQALPWQGDPFHELSASNHPSSAQQVRLGEGEISTQLLGMAFTFQSGHQHFLLTKLPNILILRKMESGFLPLIHPAIEFLTQDISPGYFAVASHLAELIIIGLLRTYMSSQHNHSIGLIKAMKDTVIYKVLCAIHESPNEHWTLNKLAARGNISRSSLSKRFNECLDVSPMEYVNQWRIHIASDLLIHSDKSLSIICRDIGFETDRTFRRVFQQYKGMPPSLFRKTYHRL